ncbi:unnamed protein product [Microthlaspi erraticum]|uniref:Uncharacterized protein n=1 Tax=Microthlaspi erraticum TaxID=1685480 RepID=A0A6D2KUQ2_9BRAS|nr:unnamed protein product [Microthlaspi erraticum]CAA7061871.1 unnamed protein product [Microthlaspi erraticum]
MAYRRRQGIGKFATFKDETDHLPPESITPVKERSSPTRSFTSPSFFRESPAFDQPRSKDFTAYETEPRGLWGVIAQKAKSVNDSSSTASQSRFSDQKMDNPKLRRGLDKLTSSLNQIGDSFEKAFEEGRTLVGNKTADIIQETRKLQTRRRATGGQEDNQNHNQSYGVSSSWKKSPEQPLQSDHTEHETQLKASRDVAMATAAKAKLLLRELRTVKADLAFAKERCAQLEEENKHLRENHREKGSNPADEDLIRLQMESLLAEKARLAHENSVYARENRFLREIVEYHQLTMQDLVYIDQGSEEVTQVYPFVPTLMTCSPSEEEMIKEIQESSVCVNVVSDP